MEMALEVQGKRYSIMSQQGRGVNSGGSGVGRVGVVVATVEKQEWIWDLWCGYGDGIGGKG